MEPFKQLLKTLTITVLIVGVNVFIFSVLIVQLLYASKIHTSTDVMGEPVAIVLGASVMQNGTPSVALRDRIMRGVELYKSGRVQTILMTGDDGLFHIDEISVMKRVAMDAGVPETAIWTDGHGYRTYESCKRAIREFGITDAIVVTQRFHLGRALFLCNELGMDAVGVTADEERYEKKLSFWMRDLLSSVKAFSDVYVFAPQPPVSY